MKNSRLKNLIIIALAAGLTGCSGFESKENDKPTPAEPEVETPVHQHTYSDEWTSDQVGHWHKSTCGHDVTTDIEKHKPIDEVKVEATLTVPGTIVTKCSVCGFVINEREYLRESPGETSDTYTVSDYYGGYYSPIVSWTDGEDLKTQLHSLITTGFTGLVYDGNWETNQIAEQSLTNFEEVNVVYSQKDDLKVNTYGGTAGANGWQREHAFCASLMTAYNTGEAVATANNGTSRATDFHNLFAAYGKANGGRGNKNLGMFNESNGVTESTAVDADTKSDKLNYEPNDCDKGRLARAIFYMGVMYNEDEQSDIKVKFNYKNANNNNATKSVTVPAKYKPIQIVEDYVNYSQITFTNFVSSSDEDAVLARTTYLPKYRTDTNAYVANTPDSEVLSQFANAYADYRYTEGKFSIGNLSTLIDWNSTPVDRQEMWHNTAVYSYVHQQNGANKGKKQGNRNPFVDYPELVDYVYGSKKDQPGELKYLRPSEDILETGSKELYNYALTSHKDKYIVGVPTYPDDYKFVRVNKDFSTQEADFLDTNPQYTFKEEDIGQKTITLNTPTGSVSYVVTVESASGVNACNYNFMINKDSFSSTKIQTSFNKLLSYEGVDYNVRTGIDDCPVSSKDTYAQIGNGTSKPASSIIFETTEDFEYQGKKNIESVYLGLNTASGCTYAYKIYVDETLVSYGTFSYNSSGPQIYGKDFDTPASGVLKIEIGSASKAFYISQISVKVS